MHVKIEVKESSRSQKIIFNFFSSRLRWKCWNGFSYINNNIHCIYYEIKIIIYLSRYLREEFEIYGNKILTKEEKDE